MIQFFKDISFKLFLAKAKTLETKGKDENANNYMNWLKPYDGKEDLIKLIEEFITSQCHQMFFFKAI